MDDGKVKMSERGETLERTIGRGMLGLEPPTDTFTKPRKSDWRVKTPVPDWPRRVEKDIALALLGIE